MGNPVNPRARGGASLSGELRASRNDREQIRRLLSNPPKPKPTPAPTGGGVVGMAEVIATPGSVVWTAGSNSLSFESVTYGTIRDPNDGTGGGESKVPISSWLSVSGHQITLAPGWYIPVLDMRLFWMGTGTCPSAFGGPYIQAGWNIAHQEYGIHLAVPSGDDSSGLWQIANHGPTYIGATTTMHAECRSVGSEPTIGNDPGNSAIIWNITKIG